MTSIQTFMETREKEAVQELARINNNRQSNGVTTPLTWEKFWTKWKRDHPSPCERKAETCRVLLGLLSYSIKYIAKNTGSAAKPEAYRTIHVLEMLSLLFEGKYNVTITFNKRLSKLVDDVSGVVSSNHFDSPTVVDKISEVWDFIANNTDGYNLGVLDSEARLRNYRALKCAKMEWFDLKISNFVHALQVNTTARERMLAIFAAITTTNTPANTATIELEAARARIAELENVVQTNVTDLAAAHATIGEFRELLA
jgi:hypothetical protein